MVKRILKNIFAVILGWIIGSLLNMGLVELGNLVFPIKGVNRNSMEELAIVIPTLNASYFIFPFLAHALGTFLGAFIAWNIASSHKMRIAMTIGGLFLLGGFAVNYLLPGPKWFTILDLTLSYLPMAYFGGFLASFYSNKVMK